MTESAEENLDLAALRRGDARAFAMLVERHQRVVLGLCQSMGLKGADIDEAAAEVFAAVFRSIARFEGRAALGTWVYCIATRVIPRVRHRLRSGASQEGCGVPDSRADEHQATPLQMSEQKETRKRLWEAVARLDERSAMAVELHYRRGMSMEEIAGVLQCPAGTVKTLLFRARAQLKGILSLQEVAS